MNNNNNSCSSSSSNNNNNKMSYKLFKDIIKRKKLNHLN